LRKQNLQTIQPCKNNKRQKEEEKPIAETCRKKEKNKNKP